jgi:hypothetical protein
MYVNGKMVPVETTSGIKEEVISCTIYLIHYKNLYKCHNVPLPITTIKEEKIFRFYLTSVTMATIKNTNYNKCWQGCGGKKTPHTLLVRM